MTFCPPAWQAAQLALKICSPAPTSPAKAGATATPAVTAAPATAALTFCSYQGKKVGLDMRGVRYYVNNHDTSSHQNIFQGNRQSRRHMLLTAGTLTLKAEAEATRVATIASFILVYLELWCRIVFDYDRRQDNANNTACFRIERILADSEKKMIQDVNMLLIPTLILHRC